MIVRCLDCGRVIKCTRSCHKIKSLKGRDLVFCYCSDCLMKQLDKLSRYSDRSSKLSESDLNDILDRLERCFEMDKSEIDKILILYSL